MESQKKRSLLIGLLALAALALAAVIWFTIIHFTTSPEEKAYNTALRYIGAMLDEKRLSQQNKKEEHETTSPIEQLARPKDEDAEPLFEKYAEEYVTTDKEKGIYQVIIEVKEVKNYAVTKEYAYDVTVQERDGDFEVMEWVRRTDED